MKQILYYGFIWGVTRVSDLQLHSMSILDVRMKKAALPMARLPRGVFPGEGCVLPVRVSADSQE